jgi:hypothetical protein|tara:strand:+ start:62 stop:577 length:516 start_codon:yes stop_codon:yes gene_type:complete
MNVKNFSRVYKLDFENGDTYYGRVTLSKNYSASTYVKDMAGRPKLNALNPLRVSMTTEVEKRVERELKSIKSEIIFEGLTSEAIEFKDNLVETDKNSLNIRKNVVMGKVMAEAIKVTKQFSKVLTSSTGAVVSYVDREWARKKGLWDVLNFSNVYPINDKFVEILKPIERI